MKEEYLRFDHLKKYVSFLYPDHLDELVKVNLEKYKELELPLLKLFSHISPQEMFEMQKKTLTEYLLQILEDKSIDTIKQNMKDWKSDKLPGIPKEKVLASDITMVYNARKYSLNKFLPLYSSDIQEILAIINELENFYTFQETLAIHTFSEIQKEEILKRENLLKESQAMAHLGNWEYDFETNKVYWSEEMFNIYGISVNDLSPEVIQKLMDKRDLDRYNKILADIKKSGGKFNIEYKIRRPDGEERTISEQGTVIIDGNDNACLRGISQDITELKRKEEEIRASLIQLQNLHEELQRTEESLKEININLEQKVHDRTQELVRRNESLDKANKDLIKINWDLDNFVYTASHDLKAPVANIEGLVIHINEILEDKGLVQDEDVSTIMEMIKTSIDKFKKTIQYLADISKVQKDLDGDFSEIKIDETINDIKENISKEIISSDAIINVDTSRCNTIHFSRRNLNSIIYNILSNAIKYRSPDRQPIVNISTEHVDGFMLLTIEDNGLGIEKDKIDQIFYMFKRLHTHVEGTGIGLYIVKRIIENHCGKINVDSEPEQGTKFEIYLKLKVDDCQ